MDELSIKVLIADRPYQLTIDRKDEETIRKAAKTINSLVKEYSNTYAFKDKQDLLAMVALNFASLAMNSENELLDAGKDLSDKLKEIEELLDHKQSID